MAYIYVVWVEWIPSICNIFSVGTGDVQEQGPGPLRDGIALCPWSWAKGSARKEQLRFRLGQTYFLFHVVKPTIYKRGALCKVSECTSLNSWWC